MARAAVWFSSTCSARTSASASSSLRKRLRCTSGAAERPVDNAGHLPLARQIVDVAQDHDHPVHGAGGIAVLAHAVDQVGDRLALDLVKGERTKPRQDMDAQHRLIGLPTVLVGAHVGQITLVHELTEPRHAAHFAPLLLRVGAQQRLGHDLARLTAGLVEAEHISRADFVLPLAAPLVGVALIVGLAARATHFQHEAALTDIEIVGLLAARRTGGLADKLG